MLDRESKVSPWLSFAMILNQLRKLGGRGSPIVLFFTPND